MSEKEEKNVNDASDKKEDAENDRREENTEQIKPAEETKKPEPEKPEQPKKEADKNSTVKPLMSEKQLKKEREKEQKHNGENPWKTAAILLAALIIGFGGGWLGGHLSAKSEIADLKEELAENQQMPSWPDFFNNFNGSDSNGSQNGNGGSSESQESPNKAALGIMVKDTENGVEIVDFTAGTNASEAGLQKGDIIVKVDDTSVSSVSELRSVLSDKEAGDTVSITVTRDGKEQDPVDVKLIDNTAKSEHSDFPDGSNIQG